VGIPIAPPFLYFANRSEVDINGMVSNYQEIDFNELPSSFAAFIISRGSQYPDYVVSWLISSYIDVNLAAT